MNSGYLLALVRVLGVVGLLSVAGCMKKGGEAVVISKEHIPATVADEASKDARPTSPEQCG